jgi:hypothetical protein
VGPYAAPKEVGGREPGRAKGGDKFMNAGPCYILRAFEAEREVITTTVAVVPGAGSYPSVGQVIDTTWRVAEILDSPRGECWIRVERL